MLRNARPTTRSPKPSGRGGVRTCSQTATFPRKTCCPCSKLRVGLRRRTTRWRANPTAITDLLAILEAARWAPSSYNEQPWRYIVATRDDREGFERVLSCLVEANRDWARHAPVLVLAAVSTRFARNDKPNRAAEHDLGLASANLTLEATKRGISVHQMIGILPERAQDVFEIPDGFEVLTGLAIGYHGTNPDVDDKFVERDDKQPKGRRPIAEFVFSQSWGRSFDAAE